MKYFSSTLFFFFFSTIILSQTTSFRVLSFNIRYPNPQDGFNYWPNRKEMVASVIQFYDADIIGLQEAFRSQLDDLTTVLKDYTWFGLCRTDGSINPQPDNEFSAILYRESRFDLLDGNTLWLSPTPETAGTKGWDASLPRIITWAKFRDKESGNTFFHFNTHFDHQGDMAREESAKLLLESITEIAQNTPVVITGDFNVNDTSKVYQILINQNNLDRLTDAIEVSQLPHHGPRATWTNSFQFPGVPGHRIDFIFIKNEITVLKHAILSDSWSGRLPSDHLPVFVELRFY